MDISFTENPRQLFIVAQTVSKTGILPPLCTIKAMARDAATSKHMSPDSLRFELSTLLVSPRPALAFRLLAITHVLDYVLPEVARLRGVTQNRYHHEDVFYHSLSVLDLVQPNLMTRWAALLHDVGKYFTKSIDVDDKVHFYDHDTVGASVAFMVLNRLGYSKDITNGVVNIVQHHMRLKQSGPDGKNISRKALRKFKAAIGEHLDAALDVMDADNHCHMPGFMMVEQIAGIRLKLDTLVDNSPVVALSVSGDDIMKHLNIPAGPVIGQLLKILQRHPKLTRDEALQLVTEEYEKGHL